VAVPFYIRPVYSLFCGDGLWKGLQSPATSTPGPKLNKTDGGEAPPKPEKEDPGPGRDPGSGFWMWAEGWTNSAGKHFHFVFAAFSDYANPGSLSTGGGYLGYLYDQVGLKCLGDWWPYVGASIVTTLAVVLLALFSYAMAILCAPVVAGWRFVRDTYTWLCPARAVTPALPRQPRDHAPHDPLWRGPATGAATATTYYKDTVKGRGGARRPNDVLGALPGWKSTGKEAKPTE
jgi:hypothetical protein